MAIGERRCDASARRSLQETRLDQVGLVQVLESSAILSDRGRDGRDSDRSAGELLDDRREDPAVELVEAVLVHLQPRQRLSGRFEVDGVLAGDVREIAQTPEEPVGDARSAAAAPRDLTRGVRPDADREDLRRPLDDPCQGFDVVEIQTQRDPEAGVERLGEKPRPRRRADQSERRHDPP